MLKQEVLHPLISNFNSYPRSTQRWQDHPSKEFVSFYDIYHSVLNHQKHLIQGYLTACLTEVLDMVEQSLSWNMTAYYTKCTVCPVYSTGVYKKYLVDRK